MPAVAVVGAGSIGLCLAGAYARAGHPVIVCGGRSRIDRIRVTVEGVTHTWPVAHLESVPDDLSAATVVVAVKAQDTAATGSWLRKFDNADTTILVAQNGVEQRNRVAPFIRSAAIVPAVVYLNAERTAPGEAVFRHVGTADLAVGEDDASRAVAERLRAGGMRVDTVHDLDTVAWAKLLTNITANPLTALTGRRAEMMRDPAIVDLARQLMLEAVAVAQAEGARLGVADVDRALAWLRNVPEGSTTSMREDRLAGRPLEHDALTGAVLRAADRHGIAVPLNRMIHALLGAIRSEIAS